VEAVHALGLTDFEKSGTGLLSLLSLQQPQTVQLAAISTLGQFNDSRVGTELAQRWPSLTPRLRSEAAAVLLARPDRVKALLQGIEAGTIQASALTTAQIKFIRNNPDKSVKQMAAKILAATAESGRQKVVEAFMPALELKGNAQHGKKIYSERCISCHRLGSEGFAVGPDLVTVKNSGKDKLLTNILDPNKEVRPDYVSFVVETKDDESMIGLIANETATSITVRQPYGKETVINRSNINRIQSQQQSLMPEGLEAGLAAQDLADLIEFIETAN
jgi:putative heme-binding domain-containing protein